MSLTMSCGHLVPIVLKGRYFLKGFREEHNFRTFVAIGCTVAQVVVDRFECAVHLANLRLVVIRHDPVRRFKRSKLVGNFLMVVVRIEVVVEPLSLYVVRKELKGSASFGFLDSHSHHHRFRRNGIRISLRPL